MKTEVENAYLQQLINEFGDLIEQFQKTQIGEILISKIEK
jgi:hypothetical protein